ncbi:hypothetical protein ACM66Z_10700 [Sulfurovum sp. ST-21]|uniref:Uncharacterized protein n=1 Tax=Sulfurovum indicum TaxID=2779528 RepID=A0A7M1S351_9BACT|nr:hypothetical protein [Sulfurovum indicum]QOR61865.1 hypothetical protein IMZ28_10685 [Sulfurovum indicum]
MSWKHYRNELIVGASLLFALAAFGYKMKQRSATAEVNRVMETEVATLREIGSLKKIWGDKRISEKLDRVRTLIPSSKVQWQKKGKKLTAVFSELKASEVNTLVTKFLNIAVQIESLKVKKRGENYSMEIRCKW